MRKAVTLWANMTEVRGADRIAVGELADAHWNLGDLYKDMIEKRRAGTQKWAAAADEYEQARVLYAGLRDRGALPSSQSHKIDELTRAVAASRGINKSRAH
jgi:hypothetical protein